MRSPPPDALDPASDIRRLQGGLAVSARSGIEGLGVAAHRNWKLRNVGHVIADHLELSIRSALGEPGGVSLGVIEVGPRSGKTVRSCVLGASRALGLDPHLQVVTGSHNRELAARNVRDARGIMQAPAYLAGYRTRLRSTIEAPGQGKASPFTSRMRIAAEDRAKMFRTLYLARSGEPAIGDGYYLSTSLAAGLTGWGFHLGICDDLIADPSELTEKNLEDVWAWFQSVFWTRRHPERNAIVLMGTRWHPQDPIGRALALWEEKGFAYYRCRLPAYLDDEPASYDWREPGEWLIPEFAADWTMTRDAIEPEAWEALYQQRPTARGGNMFKETDFGRYDPAALPDFEAVVISVDPASKKTGKSRCALGVWGIHAGRLFRLDQRVGRWDYAELEAEFLALLRAWPEATGAIVEDTSNGVPLLSRLGGQVAGLEAIKPPANSKETRASLALPYVRAGRILLPSRTLGRISDRWVPEYLAELGRFPLTPNDLADETTQVVQWCKERGYFRIEVVGGALLG